MGDDVRVWQEHESPFDVVADILKSRGITSGNIGFENSVRYFVVTGMSKAMPAMNIVPAEPVTLGCRMYKTSSELALMHKANEVTLRAYAFVFENLQEGMSQQDVKALMNSAQQRLGGSNTWCLALFNDASAYPHGTNAKQVIKEGSVVLLDSGCSVHGYQSDISRTLVFGKASQKLKMYGTPYAKGRMLRLQQRKWANLQVRSTMLYAVLCRERLRQRLRATGAKP